MKSGKNDTDNTTQNKQTYTKLYKHLHNSTQLVKQLQTSKNSQNFAKLYKTLQNVTNIKLF